MNTQTQISVFVIGDCETEKYWTGSEWSSNEAEAMKFATTALANDEFNRIAYILKITTNEMEIMNIDMACPNPDNYKSNGKYWDDMNLFLSVSTN